MKIYDPMLYPRNIKRYVDIRDFDFKLMRKMMDIKKWMNGLPDPITMANLLVLMIFLRIRK